MKIAGFRIIYGPSTIGRIYREASEKVGVDLRYVQPPAQGTPMPPLEWLEFAREEADAVFFGFPADFMPLRDFFDRFCRELQKPVVPVVPEALGIGGGRPELARRAVAYHLYGGKKNIEQFFLWLGELSGKLPPGSSLPPEEVPWAGVYHPDSDRIWTDLEQYLGWYGDRRPLLGLLLPRVFWIEDNLAPCNAFLKEFEKRGAGVVAVFSDGWFGQVRNDDVIRKFFFRHGKPAIDLLIVYGAFFLKTRYQGGSYENESCDVLKELGVPILTMIFEASQTEDQWRQNPQGLNLPQVIISVTLPEFDGLVEPILVSATDGKEPFARNIPISEQIDYFVDRALKWVELKGKTNSQKRVAFVLLNSPCKSAEATVGTAFGLDSLESMVRILRRMRDMGYAVEWVPKDGKELIEEILSRKALPDFRWTSVEEIVTKGGAAARVSLLKYRKWFSELPLKVQERVRETWGDPDQIKELSGVQKLSFGLYGDDIVIPGILNGNVFIGVQPKRGCAGSQCNGEVCKILHDPDAPPPHQWLAWHRWIEEEFKADVIVHVGTHGSLELLPGKSVGLSRCCFPWISLGKVPHLYIYNVTNPMEAVIAKRRGNAVIVDHLPPVLAAFELQDELADLEELLEDYQKALLLKESARAEVLLSQIEEKAKKANLLPEGAELDPSKLHEKLTVLRESRFRDGLHILGQPPEGRALAETLDAVLRADLPDSPSLRRTLAQSLGLDYDQLQDAPDQITSYGVTARRLLGKLDRLAREVLLELVNHAEKGVEEAITRAKERVIAFAHQEGFSLKETELLQKVLEKALKVMILLGRTGQEIDNLLLGFDSGFIEPGASGSLARGKVELLPTGRNMYSIDPWRIPTQAAWVVGKKLAEGLISRYLLEEGTYPESIGFSLRALDPYRADGEMLAQIFYTLGVEPVWSSGRVVSLRPIPLEVLGRPRIDCVVNLSSILRDGMPRAFELIDQAVQMVAELPEPLEQNFVKKHVLEREKELSKQGLREARRLATLRVFSSAPGTYGTGVELAVSASAWKTEADLAAVYFRGSGYAYGIGIYGKEASEELIENCRHVVITFEKFDSDEIDLLDCCHIYGTHGGFTNAVEVASGREVKALFGDTHDPSRPKIRTLREELSRIARTTLLNPHWIEGMKRHGYKGAGDISSRINHMYGWQATTRQVENWVFDGIAERYVLDEANRQFFRENNPYALEEIIRRLMEAAERGLWTPSEEVMEALKEAYVEVEGWLEEGLTEVKGEIQGGTVTVFAIDDLPGIGDEARELKSKLNS